MKSWKIGQFAGIGVYVHWSFLILPLLIASSTLSDGHGMGAALRAVLFVLAIFGCVVLHEFGHALMARQFGIGTRRITLLPIGGLASLEGMPRKPLHELAIAVAGPAVNVVIAGVLLVALVLFGAVGNLLNNAALANSFMVQLFWANVVLVVFNMLPAFPMDGGRVLRSALASFLPHARATQIAVIVGQGMAVLFAIGAIWSQHWMLLFVAAFVYFAGKAEARMVRSEAAIDGWRVEDAMRRQFHMVPGEMTLDEAAGSVLLTSQDDFPVVEGNRLVGMLAKSQAFALMTQGRGYLRVSDAMRENVPALDQQSTLNETIAQMQAGNYTSMPVASGGRLVGVLSAASLNKLLSGWTVRPTGKTTVKPTVKPAMIDP